MLGGLLQQAEKMKATHAELAELRAKLHGLRNEQTRIAQEAKTIEDQIAEIELKMEADPKARQAAAVLDTLKELLVAK